MESKHQIILPKEDHVTRVIIDDYHRACGHSGREHVLASVRQKFWITQGSSTVRDALQAIAKRVETLTVKHPIMRDIEVSTF